MSEHFRGSYYGSSPPELRLVLLGNLGCGKTSSADTILGQLSPISPAASRSCQVRQGVSEGRSVTLVEAPRWYWTGGKMEDSVRGETERAMTLVAPGPHGILLLVPVSQFTEMEGRVPAELEELFGREALDHTLVLLTCGDYLMGKTAEEYLQKEHPGLRQMIERCGGRYHVINNRQRQDREQVCELLEKVERMVQQNGVYHMKTAQERELEKRVNDRKRELMESYRAQREERREMVASTRITDTETQRSRRQERDEMEARVGVSQVSNGLHSTPAAERQSYSESHDDREVKRTPSFRLNQDGAILSQMSEAQSSPKMVTTFHHRINSFEEKSPEASPTSSPHSPVFSSSPSSPTFAAFPSSFPSSSSSTSAAAAAATAAATAYPSSASLSSPELRLVLVGRSGGGKSAAGNRILGREEFKSYPDSFATITQECVKKKGLVEGRRVSVLKVTEMFVNAQNLIFDTLFLFCVIKQ
uniref:AIG1-type G domain-containing protein n=1 Tax=Lates calcarifer TaxID=8187 RepID=A0A4W6FUJ1_LATCA